MRALWVEATHFRNLTQVALEPHPRFNVFHGDNGQGKTNLLEAIYLLGTLRSFRATRNEELVMFGQPRARVRAEVTKSGVTRQLEVEVGPQQKRARIDGKGARASDYFGGLNVVLFAPEDLRLPKGPPAQRRRFLDRAIWNARPTYLAAAQTYDRVLRSRNALLRQGGGRVDETMLEVYDEQLALAAQPIVRHRREVVALLAPRVEAAWRRITQTGIELAMSLESRLGEVALDEVAPAMRSRLSEDRRKDLVRATTSSGPHTDDIELTLAAKSARLFASQGQLRAIVLALKIAEIEFITDALTDAPALLLDDVSSELDATRNAQLFEFLNQIEAQTFLTTTDPAHVRLSGESKRFRVVNGGLFS